MSDVDAQSFVTEGDRDIHILYGSQSGNSEAWLMRKEATKYGLNPTVTWTIRHQSMSGMSRVRACSTWGEGEMPDNAEELQEAAGVGKILTNTHFPFVL